MGRPEAISAAGDAAAAASEAERLLIEAAQREPHRFAELYEKNFERVYAYIVRRVRDRDEAEDLTSEVFHQALAHLPRFEWRGVPFAAWLFRIAANAITDRGVRAARERGAAVTEEPVDETTAEDVEERARLFRLVQRLPADQRLVVMKRFAEQQSVREIAVELGRSEGAVKQLQFRGLQTLRALLGENDA
jgi:RNA polymerase sigma-70 factor (ECF subfamily)